MKLKNVIKLSFVLHGYVTYFEQVQEVDGHLHDREHADTGRHCDQARVHVLIRSDLLRLDRHQPLQELMSLSHLIS